MPNLEIERKFLVKELPQRLDQYEKKEILQAYLAKNPVVRIRKSNEQYILTYKGEGLMVREEYNLPLTKEAFYHLLEKADGIPIQKVRYLIPLKGNYTIELDVFMTTPPFVLAEVEFLNEKEAQAFLPPPWFGEEVTQNPSYQNCNIQFDSMPLT